MMTLSFFIFVFVPYCLSFHEIKFHWIRRQRFCSHVEHTVQKASNNNDILSMETSQAVCDLVY